MPTRETTPEALFAMIQPQLELLRNIGGLTLSGGEALLQTAGAVRLLELARNAGFHTTVETSGLLPLEYFTAVAGHVDCWLFGIRSDGQGADAPEAFGRRGKNLEYLASLPSRVIVRKPLVAGVTDTVEEIEATMALMKACGVTQIDLFPLNTHTSHFYRALGQVAPAMDSFIPSAERVAAVRERFAESGFSVSSYNDAANLTQGE
jgi:pyruvate formate lyase activating enzyme